VFTANWTGHHEIIPKLSVDINRSMFPRGISSARPDKLHPEIAVRDVADMVFQKPCVKG